MPKEPLPEEQERALLHAFGTDEDKQQYEERQEHDRKFRDFLNSLPVYQPPVFENRKQG